MSCVTDPSKQKLLVLLQPSGRPGRMSTTRRVALIVSLLTQCLVQFCHLWMVPARCLGLMARKRQKNETKAEESVNDGGAHYRPER